MSDWDFEENEVLEAKDGKWWHVAQRLVDVDADAYDRFYTLWDATHSEKIECFDAIDLEDMYDRTGIVCSGKPAAKHGYRVNGVLCGPSEVDHFKGNACLHDHECPNCGESGNREIDVIVDHAENTIRYLCRGCEREVTKDNE